MATELKNVEFVGFESHPDLRALADRANTLLEGITNPWRDEVHATWRPAPPESGAVLELTLPLTLWNAADSITGYLHRRSFEPGEEGRLRSDIRFIWMDLLGRINAQQMKRLEESLQDAEEE